MRVIFLGTPEFAIPVMRALIAGRHEIAAVVTQPDRARGRGHGVSGSPVKDLALENGLRVLQYDKISAEGAGDLSSLNADIMITAAYGQILSRQILDVCPYGVVNVHASILPKYRGAAPIRWAIINGETKTGVTIMQTDIGLDTGDIILCRETEIDPADTGGTLTESLSHLGAETLIEALDLIESGGAVRVPQDESEATRYPMITKELGVIDWARPAVEINNLIRGLNPWPAAAAVIGGRSCKLWTAGVVPYRGKTLPGTVITADAKFGLTVRCGADALEISELTAPGGKRMSARAYLAGNRLAEGTVLE
ncbi:MAG: methionyl-tRNA formyltransferase [Clostridiales bacterium]|jgi:methionyl-tRNA formyltransferase|nr:methionyl-tRNA formyltransferase [Clostridiales bacterium]